jgi:hypothetical protein
MFKWIKLQFEKIKLEIRYRHRLRKIKKRDPYIYK